MRPKILDPGSSQLRCVSGDVVGESQRLRFTFPGRASREPGNQMSGESVCLFYSNCLAHRRLQNFQIPLHRPAQARAFGAHDHRTLHEDGVGFDRVK